VTSTISRFTAAPAPCGKILEGERFVTEDQQGLVTEEMRFDCGCLTTREEFHDGSVHRMEVSHRHNKVLVDEEIRGE
jgi:hypothetical protein